MMKNLDHPNIIKIHEYFQDNERIYIIMELCKGGDLAYMINKKRKEKNFFTER
jgi:serine/threonine protein kinase